MLANTRSLPKTYLATIKEASKLASLRAHCKIIYVNCPSVFHLGSFGASWNSSISTYLIIEVSKKDSTVVVGSALIIWSWFPAATVTIFQFASSCRLEKSSCLSHFRLFEDDEFSFWEGRKSKYLLNIADFLLCNVISVWITFFCSSS